MKVLRIGLVGCLALLAAVSWTHGEDRPASDDVRVMSFNIRYGTAKDGDPMEGTFSNFRGDMTKGARIDWIGASRGWQVVEAAIDRTAREGRTPSDHFAVTALLRPADVKRPVEPPAGDTSILMGGPFEVDSVLDVTYCEGEEADLAKHKLDLFLPKGHKNFPVLFFIHGGAWVSGDRKLYGSMSQDLCRQLQKKQVASEVKEMKDRNHISIMFRMMLTDTDATAQELLKFVAQHAGLKLTPRAAAVQITP